MFASSSDLISSTPCVSPVFQEEFDVLASVTYGGLVVLELGIFILAAILNPRMERRKREELERAAAENNMRATADVPLSLPGDV